MEQLRLVFNFCLENWHVIGIVLLAFFSWIFGKAKVLKVKKEIGEIFFRTVKLFNTVKEALEDKKITKEEATEIKKDIDLLLSDFRDLILIFKK